MQVKNRGFVIKIICFFKHLCAIIKVTFKCALRWENLSSGFVNNKGADQPAHLVNIFVIGSLECIMSKLATSKSSIF